MIRIVIVEDHTLFREGIKSILTKIPDFAIVAEFNNGKDFCDRLFDLESDIVLMDIEMPVMNGIEAARTANIKKPGIQIIALSMYNDRKYYYEMIRAGISGFVLKEATTTELEKAIRDVSSGMGFFSPDLLRKAILGGGEPEKKAGTVDHISLSGREREVLNLICRGLSNNEISEKLFLSPKTIESHRSRLFQKTNTRNAASLVIYSIKNELIDIRDFS